MGFLIKTKTSTNKQAVEVLIKTFEQRGKKYAFFDVYEEFILFKNGIKLNQHFEN